MFTDLTSVWSVSYYSVQALLFLIQCPHRCSKHQTCYSDYCTRPTLIANPAAYI